MIGRRRRKRAVDISRFSNAQAKGQGQEIIQGLLRNQSVVYFLFLFHYSFRLLVNRYFFTRNSHVVRNDFIIH